MQLTEREYYATQPLQTERAPRGIRRSAAIERAPQGILGALARVIRVEASLAVLTPASVAALLAWWQTGRLDVPALVLTLAGLLVSAWGLAAWAEYADYLVSQRSPGVRSVPDVGASAYAMMERGVLAPSTVRDTGLIQLAIGALCTLWLTVLVGWPPLFFNGLSFLLAAIAIWGPLRYGFAGWGLGELVLWLAVGVLPALTSYYVQAQTIGWLPVWAGIAFGLLAALHYLNRSTVHYRRDWRIHKRTLTVNLGLTRTLDASALLTIAAHVAILLMVVFMDLPLLALMALGALPVALGAFAPMNRDQPTPHQCRRIYWTGLHATMLAGLLFGLALVFDRMV